MCIYSVSRVCFVCLCAGFQGLVFQVLLLFALCAGVCWCVRFLFEVVGLRFVFCLGLVVVLVL